MTQNINTALPSLLLYIKTVSTIAHRRSYNAFINSQTLALGVCVLGAHSLTLSLIPLYLSLLKTDLDTTTCQS